MTSLRINSKIAGLVGAVFILAFVTGLLLAPGIAERRINKKIASIAEQTGCAIKYDSIEVSGFLHIRLIGLSAESGFGERFAYIERVDVTINPICYVFGGDAIGNLLIANGDILIRNGMLHNRDSLHSAIPRASASGTETESELRSMIKKVLRLMPDQVSVSALTFRYGNGNSQSALHLLSIEKRAADIMSSVSMSVGEDSSSFIASGTFDGDSWNMLVRSADTSAVHIPYAVHFSDSYVGFDSVRVVGEFISEKSLRAVNGFWIYNSAVSHFRLSNQRVRIPYFAGSIDAGFSNDQLQIYDKSYIQLNAVTVDVKMALGYRSPKHLVLDISSRPCLAQDVAESLPPGMLTCLNGIVLDGQIALELHADIDYAHLPNLKFDVAVHASDFKIHRHGDCNLGMMSRDFNYSVYEDGRFVRQISVSPANPNFVSYDEISPFLRESVQIAEDGQFFSHRGFIGESFRHALVQNLTAGRFVRGGSTISQQLVKNVFLSRTKTIFRKLEEAAIVWLIEEQRLTSKQRMLEVYLNVIEWGPNVYGIAEAADFYFGTSASQLTLAESIYLASLVPKPKKFMYSFDKEGQLCSHYVQYYRMLTHNLVTSGRIQPSDTVGLQPISALTGRASQFIADTDTISAEDSLERLDIFYDDSTAYSQPNNMK